MKEIFTMLLVGIIGAVVLTPVYVIAYNAASAAIDRKKNNDVGNRLEIILKLKEMNKAGILTDDLFDYISKNDPELRKLKNTWGPE